MFYHKLTPSLGYYSWSCKLLSTIPMHNLSKTISYLFILLYIPLFYRSQSREGLFSDKIHTVLWSYEQLVQFIGWYRESACETTYHCGEISAKIRTHEQTAKPYTIVTLITLWPMLIDNNIFLYMINCAATSCSLLCLLIEKRVRTIVKVMDKKSCRFVFY